MSALLFPPPELRRPAMLTAWAAVAVCKTIQQLTDRSARIKWPNDVLLGGRKVCGILLETRTGERGTGNKELTVVAGIGLNVNQTAEHLTDLPEATSLGLAVGKRFDHREVARALIRQMDEDYQQMRQGDTATLEAAWQGRLGLWGKPVIAECIDGSHRGQLREVAWTGLELHTADGQMRRLLPEKVRHLYPA